MTPTKKSAHFRLALRSLIFYFKILAPVFVFLRPFPMRVGFDSIFEPFTQIFIIFLSVKSGISAFVNDLWITTFYSFSSDRMIDHLKPFAFLT